MPITLERIKNIALDIIADDEWVIVGGHSGIETALYNAEHKGIVYGLNELIKHLEETNEGEE
tara:strand:- start:650 stop:835 length:186 start_codon:yes stop_codon:yes gene_type:complete